MEYKVDDYLENLRYSEEEKEVYEKMNKTLADEIEGHKCRCSSNIFAGFYLNIKLIHSAAVMPNQSGDSANAGYDIYTVDDITFNPGDDKLVPSGWCCEFPPGFVMIVKDKGGRRWKGKLQTGAGVVDSNYRDEVQVVMKNIGDKPITIKRGEKVAQFIIIPAWNGTPVQVEELNMDNDRGGGFGSTGLTNKN